MSFTLPDLPYPENALEPHISKATVGFHYHKHHSGYVARLNQLTAGTELEGVDLEEVILTSKSGDTSSSAIFNSAAQIWNHTFYWESMAPAKNKAGKNAGGDPSGALAEMVATSFGSADKFREEFTQAATGLFGSGWVWLVATENSKLEITTTQNADLPLASGKHALLTLDVWEHAYYLDYQNLRADYVKSWLDNLVNWEFANTRLGKIGT